MESVPYVENSRDDYFLRVFKIDTPSDELKWHFDDENRVIIPISGKGWKLQIDESLPEELILNKEYVIPVDVYHRIIKGEDDLEIKLYKLDSVKGEYPKHVRKYTDNPNFSDYLLYHIQNDIRLHENIFRYGSDAWCDLIQEVRELYLKDLIELQDEELQLVEDDAGKIVFINGEKIILNTPFLNDDKTLDKKYYVYICKENNLIEKIYFDAGE